MDESVGTASSRAVAECAVDFCPPPVYTEVFHAHSCVCVCVCPFTENESPAVSPATQTFAGPACSSWLGTLFLGEMGCVVLEPGVRVRARRQGLTGDQHVLLLKGVPGL